MIYVCLADINNEESYKQIISEITSLSDKGYLVVGVNSIQKTVFLEFEEAKCDTEGDFSVIEDKNSDYIDYVLHLIRNRNCSVDDIHDARIEHIYTMDSVSKIIGNANHFLSMVENNYICTGVESIDHHINDDNNSEIPFKLKITFEYNCSPNCDGHREEVLKCNNMFGYFMRTIEDYIYHAYG